MTDYRSHNIPSIGASPGLHCVTSCLFERSKQCDFDIRGAVNKFIERGTYNELSKMVHGSLFNVVPLDLNALGPFVFQTSNARKIELFQLLLQPLFCGLFQTFVVSKPSAAKVGLQIAEQIIITWGQVWTIGWVIKVLKATLSYEQLMTCGQVYYHGEAALQPSTFLASSA